MVVSRGRWHRLGTMSVSVALTALADRVAEFGPVAHLVTVGDSGTPHVVSVAVGWDGDDLTAGAGTKTAHNAGARPQVTLLWPAHPGGAYSLIVDGQARLVSGGA